MFKTRFSAFLEGADLSVVVAFFLLGVINNVIYVITLSAAFDLVGPNVPKGVVLLADDGPGFLARLVCPYFIHKVPYWIRVLMFCALSSGGIMLVALTPTIPSGGSVRSKLFGVVLASLSTGVGELSFIAMTHYYGHTSLAAWGSGTGGAGLIGAGLYFVLTSIIGLTVKTSLLASSVLPVIMLVAFFIILPHGPLRGIKISRDYEDLSQDIDSDEQQDHSNDDTLDSLLGSSTSNVSEAYSTHSRSHSPSGTPPLSLVANLRRTRALFIPYILPIILVYVGEYTINQAVAPTLLFPLPTTPFTHYRSFYPFYNLLYQIGVFIARSSIAFMRINSLYVPSMIQLCNLLVLVSQSLWNWVPSVWLIFAAILWEGLLGGVVYVNTFANILDRVRKEDREFSLAVTSVGPGIGICIAATLGMIIEPRLCEWQVERGRPWCKIYDG